MKPESIGGVVHGGNCPPIGGSIPVLIAKYNNIAFTTGTAINGTPIIGFITIGVPNNIGSLMLNKADGADNLPSCLN